MHYFNIDIPCPSCGYNLHGLSLAHGCPECGLKVVSVGPSVESESSGNRIDAEIDEHLRIMDEEAQRRNQIDELVESWQKRGERFDRVLDRMEKLLDRYDFPESGKS